MLWILVKLCSLHHVCEKCKGDLGFEMCHISAALVESQVVLRAFVTSPSMLRFLSMSLKYFQID